MYHGLEHLTYRFDTDEKSSTTDVPKWTTASTTVPSDPIQLEGGALQISKSNITDKTFIQNGKIY